MATLTLLHRMRPRGLHGRLMWLVSLVTLLTIGALGAHTLATESELALESLRAQASAMARSLALSSVNPMLTDQLDQIEQALLREMVFPGVVSAQVIDAHGAILGHAEVGPDGAARLVFDAPGSRLALPAQASTELLAGQLAAPGRMVAWQPVAAGELLGWARVETRLDPLDALNRQVWLRTLAAGALTVAGSSLLLLWLLRSPMRALDQARAFAADLVRADGRQLVVAADGPQETVDLGHALNQAATRLSEQRETIAATLDQLRQQQLELQDSNLQLGAIFELSPDGLVLFDGESLVRFANPAFFRLTGLAPAAVVGHDQAALEAQLGALCAEPSLWAGLAPYFEQPSGNGQDGDPIRGRLLVLSAPRPSVLAVLGRQAGGAHSVLRLLYLRDVTHETEVDRLKSEFVSTAAHELRTPIASIHGFTELLRMREYPSERRQQILETIHRNSAAMIRIVNDLLDLSRLEARRGKDFLRERGDLGEFLRQSLADHAPPPGRDAPVAPVAPVELGPLPAWFDRGKIAQVLGNLLGNAYKYSPSGGAVQVQLLRDHPPGAAGRVGFSVTDAGIGMTPAQVARIFERFYRADPSGAILGTGLGMSIAKEIVDLHGGSLVVTSSPGQGTCVSVWLPLAVHALASSR